jgi:hypothetical protein
MEVTGETRRNRVGEQRKSALPRGECEDSDFSEPEFGPFCLCVSSASRRLSGNFT